MNQIQENLDTKIIQIIARLSPVPAAEITLEARLREDLGFDSVASMELLSYLAEELDLRVGLEEVADVFTVGDAIEMAKKDLASRAG